MAKRDEDMHARLHTQPSSWMTVALLAMIPCLMACIGSVPLFEDGKAAVEEATMFDLIKKGGPLMIPLGIASVLAMAIALERFISLKKDRVLPPAFLGRLDDAWKSDSSGKAAIALCDSEGGTAGHIFKAGVRWRTAGYEAIGKAMAEAGSREAEKMKRSVRSLALIAKITPTMGLLGTVYGMIGAFQKTSEGDGAAKPAELAGGIYEALVTTAAGLTIAIPVALLYQFLIGRIDGLIDHIDEVGTEFVISRASDEGVLTQGLAETLPTSEAT